MDKPKARLSETTVGGDVPRRPWVPPHISAESTTITNHLKRRDAPRRKQRTRGAYRTAILASGPALA